VLTKHGVPGEQELPNWIGRRTRREGKRHCGEEDYQDLAKGIKKKEVTLVCCVPVKKRKRSNEAGIKRGRIRRKCSGIND